jgi:hypothetical protein
MANYTDPIESVFQCIAQLGDAGCGFEHQLASIDRALGADGQGGPPASNANFLRKDAYLGIVLLTNEDDCSAPPNTAIYSLNGGGQTIKNPDGPLGNYRCNGGQHGAHYCKDPATGQMMIPPLFPPSDAAGNPAVLNLTDCEDNETTGTSALTPVSKFVGDIRGLKDDPDRQIFVAAIAAPPEPYGVVWVPPTMPPPGAAGEVWPQVMHSCGAQGGDDVNPMITQTTTDGSFGDPGVRIKQFVDAFGANSGVFSICDANYRQSMTAIATALGRLLTPTCISGAIQKDQQGEFACTVTNHLTNSQHDSVDVVVQACSQNGNQAPCWTMQPDTSACPAGGMSLKVTQDAAVMSATSVNATVECSLCVPGTNTPGC